MIIVMAYYWRRLDTELGPIDNLKIPRSRLGLFRTKVFEYYQRRQKAVNTAIQNVFSAGVSTRDVSYAIETTSGDDILCLLCITHNKELR